MLIILSFLVTLILIIMNAMILSVATSNKTKMENSLVIAISFLISILGLFLIGAISIFFSPILTRILVISLLIIDVYHLLNKQFRHKLLSTFKGLAAPITAWVLTGLIAILFSGLHIAKPPTLPDGAYVFKDWSKPVEMQYVSGELPMDNALPYYTAEFLVRHIDLTRNHPIMPGQEIVNRTYGIPMGYLAIRSIITLDNSTTDLPTLSYVGVDWPDVRILYNLNNYLLFCGFSFAIESFVIFTIAFILVFLYKRTLRYLEILLIATFPYLINQTYFTWTKSATIAATILMYFFWKKRNNVGMALSTIVGFLIHPMILIFVLAFIVINYKKYRRFPTYILLSYVSIAIAWKIYIHQTGLTDSLIQQNFLVKESLVNQIESRIVSIGNFVSLDVLRVFPFNSFTITKNLLFGAFSLVAFYLLYIFFVNREIIKFDKLDFDLIKFGVISLFISDLIYGLPAMLIFVGGQLLVIALLVNLNLVTGIKRQSFLIPIGINILVLTLWMYAVHPISFSLSY